MSVELNNPINFHFEIHKIIVVSNKDRFLDETLSVMRTFTYNFDVIVVKCVIVL